MDLPEEVKENIRIIFTSGYTLHSMLNNVLDFSKIETGNRSLQLQPVDIESIITNSINVFQAGAKIKGNG